MNSHMNTPVPDANGFPVAYCGNGSVANGSAGSGHAGQDAGPGVGLDERAARAALQHALCARVAGQLADKARADAQAGRPPMTADERRELGVQLIGQALQDQAADALAAGQTPLAGEVEQQLARSVFDALFAMGPFQPLLDDPGVEDITANGCDEVFVGYADGTHAQVAPVASSDEELVELIRTAAVHLGTGERRFDAAAPMLSMQLPGGERLTAVMAVSARPSVAIRRYTVGLDATLADLVERGMASPVVAAFLAGCVRARKNILICGGTGMGKTTLLRALAGEIDPGERLITVEDAFELGLHNNKTAHPNVLPLQTRPPNVEGEGEIPLPELVRVGLRMAPDRVIVGEVRGCEIVPMLNAMTQGNDGTMTTIHASSSQIAFTKLAAYAIQAEEHLPMDATAALVASAIHFVVHLTCTPEKVRVVSSIREVVDADDKQVVSNETFRPGPDRRAIPAVPLRCETAEELEDAGFDLDLLTNERRWQA